MTDAEGRVLPCCGGDLTRFCAGCIHNLPDREPPADTSWVQMEEISDGPGYGLIIAPLFFAVMLAVVVIVAVLS